MKEMAAGMIHIGAAAAACEVWPGTRVGANCIRPIRRPPTGPNEYVWRPSLLGRL